MDLHNARILIRKLNSLFKSIDDAEADISQIERDLMLSYLRQLYALFLDDKAPQAHSPAESAPPKAEPLHVRRRRWLSRNRNRRPSIPFPR
ncbi:MAG: hypothetical protein IPI11_13765 [Haliscomenobacter sp.]|nr:hypothetical protein [Haliscomenobacter sp.]